MNRSMKRIVLAFICAAWGISMSAQTSPNGKLKAEKFDDHITVSYKQNGKWQEIYTAEFKGINGGDTRNIKDDYMMLSGKRRHCVNKRIRPQPETLPSAPERRCAVGESV